MTKDKTIGVPMAVPIIGGGQEQKVSMDELLQNLMQNIQILNQDYRQFVQTTKELSNRLALLETRMSAVETKQVAFPSKIEVVVKKEQ